MPKRVDHEERRGQIAAALWRLASAGGLEDVSVRRVAAEAGMSAPLVQHYFPSKDAMLRFALSALAEHSAVRAQARVAAGTDPASPTYLRDLVRAVLAELLPLDAERRTMLRVHLAYFTRALRDPEVAAILRDDSPGLTELVATLLRQGRDAGTVTAGVDLDREAETLVSLAIGAGVDMLLGARTEDDVNALLDYHLNRLNQP